MGAELCLAQLLERPILRTRTSFLKLFCLRTECVPGALFHHVPKPSHVSRIQTVGPSFPYDTRLYNSVKMSFTRASCGSRDFPAEPSYDPAWRSVAVHHEWQHQLLSLCLFIRGPFGLLLSPLFPSLSPPLSWTLSF